MGLIPLTELFSFLLGAALGSFANVCIHRIPRRQSVVRPPSSCPHCGKRIAPLDNIPLLSYVLLKGKCRHCGGTISLRYPLVEALTGLLSLALFIRYGPTVQYLFFLAFIWILVTISFIDLDEQIIPHALSVPGVLLGLTASFFAPNRPWLDSLIGIAAGWGSLYLVAACFRRLTGKEGMGGGDMVLLAMLGAWLGWRSLPLVVLLSSVLGILIGGGALLTTRKGLGVRIPFGPFLSLGGLSYLFFGRQILAWYTSLWM